MNNKEVKVNDMNEVCLTILEENLFDILKISIEEDGVAFYDENIHRNEKLVKNLVLCLDICRGAIIAKYEEACKRSLGAKLCFSLIEVVKVIDELKFEKKFNEIECDYMFCVYQVLFMSRILKSHDVDLDIVKFIEKLYLDMKIRGLLVE